MTNESTVDTIELRVDEITQLFHTLNPFPFRERDLDREVEDFIVGWARELPVDQNRHPFSPTVSIRPMRHGSWATPSADIFPIELASSSETLMNFFGLAGVRSALALLFSLGASSPRISPDIFIETPFQRLVEGELPHTRLGRKLASSRNLPLRLVAHRTSARVVSPPFQSSRGSQAIPSRTIASTRCYSAMTTVPATGTLPQILQNITRQPPQATQNEEAPTLRRGLPMR